MHLNVIQNRMFISRYESLLNQHFYFIIIILLKILIFFQIKKNMKIDVVFCVFMNFFDYDIDINIETANINVDSDDIVIHEQ